MKGKDKNILKSKDLNVERQFMWNTKHKRYQY